MNIPSRLLSFYSTEIHLPASMLSRRVRTASRRLRGKPANTAGPMRLPAASWRACTPARPVHLHEPEHRSGNVRLSELSILARFAADCPPETVLFEIGTFDGRTALNLALNAPQSCRVVTLDLPPETPTRHEVVSKERKYIDKPVSGGRIAEAVDRFPSLKTRVEQQYGDSATFNDDPYAAVCSLVFVDGSHAYEYARCDSATARRLVRPGGVIIWHDYGVWDGVTQALHELEDEHDLGLTHIKGTSLVCWRAPADG